MVRKGYSTFSKAPGCSLVSYLGQPIDGTLRGTTILGQSGPENNGNEEVLHIPQSSRIKASPSDGLVLYKDIHLRVVSYPSVYSTAPADWAAMPVVHLHEIRI